MDENLQVVAFDIIFHSGNARALVHEAFSFMRGSEFEKAEEKLEEANQAMADLTYKQTVALTGEMVKDGHSLMKLKYDLLD